MEGLSSPELDEIAEDQGVVLPAAYRGFLEVAGRACGRLWVGTDAFYPVLLGVKQDAIELMEEFHAPFSLAATDVVIGMNQGYEFLYLSGPGDDPPVSGWHESHGSRGVIFDSFTHLVEAELRELSA